MPSNISITFDKPAHGPSITVCVPVYNVKPYLRECLDSIFSQDYPYFSVVIIDDGSTDRSGEICDEYVAKNPQRALVVHKDNEGPLLARRDAFARAAGLYVMCVDSDDMLLPGAITAVATAINKTGADVVRFGFTRELDEADPKQVDNTSLCKFYPAMEKPLMLRSVCCSTSGSENPMWFKAVRRDCVGVDVDYSEFKSLTFAEDFLQTLTIYDRAETFCFLSAALYYYRPGSGITRAYNPHFYRDVCRCLNVAEGFAQRWEADYSCGGLVEGLSACRLDSGAQYAEWMALQGDKVGLDNLRASYDFIRCSSSPDAEDILRFDRRVVISALKHKNYLIISAVARLRTFRKKIFSHLSA